MKLVDIACDIRIDKAGQSAIAIADGTEETVRGEDGIERKRLKFFWLPRSHIEIDRDQRTGRATVTMPEWLAVEKGLV